MELPGLFRFDADRMIVVMRVALAAFSLFAIWLDPAEPQRYVGVVYSLHVGYVTYSAIIAALVFRRAGAGWLPIATHAFDIIIFSVFQYLTMGPSSPFFIYFIFFLFCSALRWGWRGTLVAIPIVMGSFVIMGISMSRTIGPTDFELNRFIIRIGYLAMVGVLLVYLGRHESQLRDEIRQLALWPSPVDGNDDEAVSGMLKYACGLMLAHRAVLVWTPEEEPRTELALWSHRGLERRRLAPDAVDPAGPATLAESSWISKDSLSAHGDIDTLVDDKAGRWTGLPVHEALATLIGEGPVASAPFRTEQLAGRVFFVDVEVPRVESLALLAAVARQVGMSLDRLASIRRQRVLDVGEERIRVAQDLHDGVLQSLTGVRLELQRVAGGLPPVEAESRNRLLTLERALALEQRELRLFIEDLKPFVRPAAEGSLVDRLDSLRRRLSEQWNVPIAVRVDARVSLDRAADEAMVPLVNEAIVNALKHAHPSRVSVDVVRDGDQTRVTVVDDGRGFAFAGRLEHEALAASGLGPVSLRERMAALGGRLNIESSTAGSRLDLLIPAGAHPGRG